MSRFILFFLVVSLFLSSCSTGLKSLQRGDYYDAILKAANRLSSDPDNRKASQVVREGYPDFTQFDPHHHHYDPTALTTAPRWYMVDVEPVAAFASILTLESLKADPALDGMLLLRKGQRLSVMPVDEAHFRHVLKLAGLPSPG